MRNYSSQTVFNSLNYRAVKNKGEDQLIRRCRRGESEAWDELFDEHYAAAGRFIFQLASDLTHEDVEEICQEVFLTVIKSLHSFQGQSRFQTWLFRIAANKAHDYRERQRAAKRGGGRVTLSLHAEETDNGLPIDPPSTAPAPDASLLNAERQQLVSQALQQLGSPCQELIELRYFGDLSYDEIGAALKINTKTVSSRLSRCLDHLETSMRSLLFGEKSPSFPSNPYAA